MQGGIDSNLLRRVAPLALVAGLAVLSITGCGGRDEEGAPKRSTTASAKPETTTTTDPLEGVESAVRSRYNRWMTSFRMMFEQPDPESAVLDDLYTDGPAKEAVVAQLRDWKANGWSAPPRPDDVTKWTVLDVKVESPTEAVVHDCLLDGAWTIGPGGEVVNDEVFTYEGSNRFVKGDDGVWRADTVKDLSVEEGEVGCAEQLR